MRKRCFVKYIALFTIAEASILNSKSVLLSKNQELINSLLLPPWPLPLVSTHISIVVHNSQLMKQRKVNSIDWCEGQIGVKAEHLGPVWLDDAAEPVQRHTHNGQRGHEGRHAGEGLDQAGKQQD